MQLILCGDDTLSREKQEILEIHKNCSQRILMQCLEPQSIDEPTRSNLAECLGMIIEEIVVISEEHVRSEGDFSDLPSRD